MSEEKMPQRSASPRQTSGTGFDFEDLTAAWILSKILVEEHLPGIGGSCTQVQSQTKALGWHVDDLLFTARGEAEDIHLAVSCKSNVQVTPNGLPSDFVTLAWEQWRETNGLMNRRFDVIALVSQGRHPTFTPTWEDIFTWCSGEDSKLAIARIRADQKHIKIFESIRTPKDQNLGTEEETVELIRHLAVIPLEFQPAISPSREEGIGRCFKLLQNGTRSLAEDLWSELKQLACEMRTGSGTLTLNAVWATLRKKFILKDKTSLEGSWRALGDLTKDYKSRIISDLPTGIVIDRKEDSQLLEDTLRDGGVTVVFGESGCGKSALVKGVLDKSYPNWNQTWLGPEDAEIATSELKRQQIHLDYSFEDILLGSVHPENVLVFDSAEKLNPETLPKIKQIIDHIRTPDLIETVPFWRVVIITQPEGWKNRLSALIEGSIVKPISIDGISLKEVAAVLHRTKELSWLGSHRDIIKILTNLKVLGWVLQASTSFQEGSDQQLSPTLIVDRIWEYWTNGRYDQQNILMKLSEREASFKKSFPQSSLSPDEVRAIQAGSTFFPLYRNSYGRFEFKHDLAADWARFQKLKEVYDDIDQWASLAHNPLWGAALRLLGQFLLRCPATDATAWDRALSALETKGEELAIYALFDALCLDPQAEDLLEQRASLLFENHGKRLMKILKRFLHIATISSVPPELLGLDPSLSIYIESKHRIPIIGFWPAIANFLYKHLQQIAELQSPIVAAVCEMWLTSVPHKYSDGSPLPFRQQFALIALATARSLQVAQGQGHIIIGDGERPIYSAAFAAAEDLPEEVSSWALEMAQRRPLDLLRKLADFGRSEALA